MTYSPGLPSILVLFPFAVACLVAVSFPRAQEAPEPLGREIAFFLDVKSEQLLRS